ncbi:MAG: extracellular solute-binding protein [Deltaproteobacteria bacterium]|nr:extracellular solute-binding protein [Deltaproteobacteria bacterium]
MFSRRLMTSALRSLALVVCATLWPGNAQAEDKPLVLWHAYRVQERAALEKTVDAWNTGGRGAHPKIKLLAVPYDAFADKITAATPRGHGPDLFIFAHDRVGDWAESKIIEPIEFWMTEKHADTFILKTIDALCYGDSLYGLPMAFKSTLLFYNKKLVPEPPHTTDDLWRVGQQLTDRKAGRYGLVYDNAKLYFHAPWLHGFGGMIFDERGKLHISSKAAVAAMNFARKISGPTGIVPPESTSTLTTTLFAHGKVAMAISGPWMVGELKKDLEVGAIPLPIVSSTGKRAAPFMGAEGIMMSAKSKRKADGFAAMKFLTSDKMALLRAKAARQPVANKAAWLDPTVKADALLSAFYAQLKFAKVMLGTPEMRLVWSPYDMALQKVVVGGGPAAPALAEAQHEVQRFLESSRKGKVQP